MRFVLSDIRNLSISSEFSRSLNRRNKRVLPKFSLIMYSYSIQSKAFGTASGVLIYHLPNLESGQKKTEVV